MAWTHMESNRVRVGNILAIQRHPVPIDSTTIYREIGIRSFGRGIIRYPAGPGSELSKLRYFVLPIGALVLSNIKAWEGAIAISTEQELDHIASNRFLSYVPVDGSTVDVRYVYHFFRSPLGAPLLERASPGVADRNRTLGIDAFENLTIPLPRIEVQRRIASKLDAVCAASASVVAKADDQLRLIAALIDRALRDVPCRAVLGEVLDLDLDVISVEPQGEYQFAGVYSFGRGMFSRGNLQGIEMSYRRLHRLRAGQVVLSRLFGFEGAIAVVPPEFDGWFLSPEFPTFSPRLSAVCPEYVAMLCSWPGLIPSLQKASKGMGVRRTRVGADAFLGLSVPLPDYGHQRRLGYLYSKLEAIRRLDKRRREVLNHLAASTLNQAFAELA